MTIKKSDGVTPTERLLAQLCDKTFLKAWSYPNPVKDDGDELCDVLVVFENNVFLFFDRENNSLRKNSGSTPINWKRWKRKAIDAQLRTADGAERYIRSGRSIYLDAERTVKFPISIPSTGLTIHKMVVAHGAKEACKEFSTENIYGSLAISYGDQPAGYETPFSISLPRSQSVHVLDSQNLEIIFSHLDTTTDFLNYIEEKRRAISRYDCLMYCGEEDLLAHYLLNVSDDAQSYRIGTPEEANVFWIGEGDWQGLVTNPQYQKRIEENRISYLWDDLIQRTCQNRFDETVGGSGDILKGQSAIHEMAKEPRISRRFLTQRMFDAIDNFPKDRTGFAHKLTFMSSHFEGVGYVFLQCKIPGLSGTDLVPREVRQQLLNVACGAARMRFPHLRRVIGIGIDPPLISKQVSEDFLLLDFSNWSREDEEYYTEQNREWKFFSSGKLRSGKLADFPE